MTFDEVLAQIIDLLKRQGRVSYGALKRRYDLDEAYLEDLKNEIIHAQQLAMDEDNRVLVWVGDQAITPPSPPAPSAPEPASPSTTAHEREPVSYTPPHLAEKILTSRSALEGERKQVTVLFCDLAHSTAIAERLGAENMHTLLNRFFELALHEVHRYEGTINQFLGDGFMALFGAPISHEDHARRGVLAAWSLQRALKEAELGQPYGVACSFRMGLNSGLVVVGSIGDNLRMDYSAIGETTNLASRLQQQAEPGDILIHETTARLGQGSIRLEALAPVEIRGKTEPVSMYKVVGTLPRRSPIVSRSERTLSEFVGRERELATLAELFAQVEAGQGQVVGVVAEAGQGKSRLLYEFRQRLHDKRVTYLEGRCLSYGGSIPYHPFIDVLRHNCGIGETDSPGTITEKVRLALQEVGMDAEASAPYLLQLLGVQEGTESIAVLTPEAVRTRTFDTFRQMSLQGCQRRPLVLEIEDLHWIDNTSEDYLASLVENLVGASILLLTTYRPGYQPAWLGKSYATQISLHSLIPHEALHVVHSTSHQVELPERLVQTIIEKAEGNPFFLEELTRVVIDHGNLHAEITVPDTIQGVLSARIDRLPETHKRLLQTASVLGREFSPSLLGKIWDGSDVLEVLLAELKRLEFIFKRTGAEETQYVFKHALTQDVAYASLLTARRQMLHAAVGQTLETLYEDRLEDTYDRLAYHYARTDNAAKAVAYLTLFAEQVAARYAREEALTILQEACQQAERLPDPERHSRALDLAIRQGRLLPEIGRTQEALDLLLAQHAFVEHLQNSLSAAQYYHRLGFVYNGLGAWERALQSAQRCLEEASQCGQEAILGQAHYLLMMVINFIGQPRRALGHGQQAIPLLERTHEWYWLGEVHFWFAFISIRLGNFEQALQSAARTEALGKTIGDRMLQWRGACMAQLTYVTKGEWDQALTWGQRSLALATGPKDASWTSASLGYSYLAQGNVAKAISLLERVVNQEAYLHAPQQQGWFAAWLGEAYAAQGRIEEAQAVVLRGLHLTRESEYWIGVGIALRALGRVEQASGALAEAASHLREALQTLADHGFRPEAARTHLDLATVAYDQGNQDSATTHLSTAYAWFKKLQVPKWVERTEQLAQEYGVTLAEVELAELAEEPS